VIAPEVAFEKFFPTLAQALQLETPIVPVRAVRSPRAAAAQSPEGSQTLDDVLAAVMSVVGPGGMLSSTAFLVANPRVIVCDAFAVAPPLGNGQDLDLIAADHQPFKGHVLRTNRAHPFGPTLLKVPETVKIPGLCLNAKPARPGDAVQIAVAAGAKTGISTGAVTETIDGTVAIDPIGRVRDLTSLKAVVRSGANGAPVVDVTMSDRGFIVAGSEDEKRPTSFMYPCHRWSKFLAGAGTGTTAKRRKRNPKR
jgi:hypothetical protein